MALFKISKGLAANLPSKKTEGWCYFTTDDGKFYIDISDSVRQVLNANHADTATTAETATRALNADEASHATNADKAGIADAADKLSAGRKISLTGDVTGSTTFDGTKNVSITAELSNTGVTAGKYGVSNDGTLTSTALAYGGKFKVPGFTVDEDGRVTAAETKEYSLPQSVDTRNTVGATNTDDKIFIVGAKEQKDGVLGYTQDTAYVGTDGHVYSNNKKTLTGTTSASGEATTLAHSGKFTVVTGLSTDGENVKATTTTFTLPNDVDTNTAHTHTAGEGLAISGDGGVKGNVEYSLTDSGVIPGTYGDDQTAGYDSSFTIPKITVDTYGRVTSVSTANIKMPKSDNVDTKVTQNARTTNGEFPILVRGTNASSKTNVTTTVSFSTGVTINPNTKTITATKFVGDLTGLASNATYAVDANFANYAGNATYANSAGSANTAVTATNANWAATANYANYAGEAAKLGNSSVGENSKLWYLNNGVPVESTQTLGSAGSPVYISNGVITNCGANLNVSITGSAAMASKLGSATVGGATKLWYLNAGTPAESTATRGGKARPVYLSNGVITNCTGDVGSATLPIYMANGTLTQCNTELAVNITGSAATATSATTAGTAGYASEAGLANTANYATTAANANYATNAGYTTNAGYAINAGYANDANYAANATYANSAGSANYAANAGYATNASYASQAGYATNANYANYSNYSNYAVNANYSNYANYSTYAGSAVNAESAGKAETANLYKSANTSIGSNRSIQYVANGEIIQSTNNTGSTYKPVYLSKGVITECGDTLHVKVNYATNANYSSYANYANNAGHAVNAERAGYATNANYSNYAGYATNANYANYAGYATNANYSNYSNYSNYAGYATNANYSNYAGSAVNAESAGKAETANLYKSINTSIGNGKTIQYVVNGEIKKSTTDVGSSTKPVYLSSGVITECGGNLNVNVTYATDANYASYANYATYAGTATSADSAGTANYANEAGSADTANTATYAQYKYVNNAAEILASEIFVTNKINALLDGVNTSYDTFKELADALKDHEDLIGALQPIISVNANRVIVSNEAGRPVASDITTTELNTLSDINTNTTVQAQLNSGRNTVKYLSNASNLEFPLVFGGSNSLTSESRYIVKYSTGITVNPNTKTITANIFNGTATKATTALTTPWSDYTGGIGNNTTDIGAANQPIFVEDGVVKASTATIGSIIKPIYMNNGVITACAGPVGTNTKPIYMANDGTLTTCESTLDVNITGRADWANYANHLGNANFASATKLWYLNAGTPAESTATRGGAARPVYLSNGVITNCTGDVGAANMPVYMSNGTITVCTSPLDVSINGKAGSADSAGYATAAGLYISNKTDVGTNRSIQHIVNGAVVQSTNTTGSSTKPVYLLNGVITECGNTLHVNVNYATDAGYATNANYATYAGAATSAEGAGIANYANYAGKIINSSYDLGSNRKFVYIEDGTLKASSNTQGAADLPVWMNAGTITACSNKLNVSINGTANKAIYDSAGSNIAAKWSNYLPTAGGTMTGNIIFATSNVRVGAVTKKSGAFSIQSNAANTPTALHLATQANANAYAAMVYKESEKCLEFQFV